MRTIKASEVVKGMRVKVVREFRDAKVTIEGVSRSDYGTGPLFPLTIGDQPVNVGPGHPVTVLAEPEPEWVEGAWYWVEFAGIKRPLRRVSDGWTHTPDSDVASLNDPSRVLGRFLAVDWPGDDVARRLLREFPEDHMAWLSPENIGGQKVADAIRTQGGVR